MITFNKGLVLPFRYLFINPAISIIMPTNWSPCNTGVWLILISKQHFCVIFALDLLIATGNKMNEKGDEMKKGL